MKSDFKFVVIQLEDGRLEGTLDTSHCEGTVYAETLTELFKKILNEVKSSRISITFRQMELTESVSEYVSGSGCDYDYFC